MVEKKTTVPSVRLSKIKKLVASLETVAGDETEVSFEFLLASLFPTCLQNITKDLQREHTLGYLEGLQQKEI